MENKAWAEEDILYVRMLGGFSVTWRGKQIVGGVKSRESQMVYFLQCLLHHRGEGVSRVRLEEILFGERDVSDIHHAMRSVLYNTKKKLREAGLPEAEYIYQENGVYYWNKAIPVKEDAREFEELYNRVKGTGEPEKQLEYLLTACGYYTGEFLPRQSGIIWAAQEARRYQEMFFYCVEQAAILLRIQEDWPRMRELGLHASKVSPFADWEVVTMEALVMMEQMNAARKLYDDTVDLYMRELGVRPSKKLQEKMGLQLHRTYAVLDSIQAELAEKEEREGGYLCAYPIFQGIYHMVKRIMERSGQSVYLMLCTLVDSKGNPMEEGPLLEELSPRMEEAICESVRHGDAVSRYRKGQYLVLLLNTTRENCSVVQKRINYRFIVGRQRTGIQYYVNSVIYSDEQLAG